MRLGPRMSDTDPKIGPTPFSTEWIDDPPAPDRPRRVPLRRAAPGALPAWLPSERIVSAVLVLVIVLTTAAFSSGSPIARELGAADVPDDQPAAASAAPAESSTADLAVVDPTAAALGAAATVAVDADATSDVAPVAEDVALAGDDAGVTDGTSVTGSQAVMDANGDFSRDANGAILPDNRIVAVYGYPTNEFMGILGEYGPDDIQGLYDEVLMPLVEQWEEADPSRPVIPAFEVIFGVAQGTPQADDSYLAHDSYENVEAYIDFAAEHDMIVLVDTQMGRRSIEQEVDYLTPLLEYPNVHLAIDPEFSVDEGEVPSEVIGQMDASEINYAQQAMADLSAEQGIPRKIVMVHQFHYTMIENKENLTDVPGVELVLHADGHGDPPSKQVTYEVMITEWVDQIPFSYGFKVWLNNDNGYGDEPRMDPVDVLELDPIPDIITYQ